MERVREEFCVLFFEGKNYLWLTTWDYGRKLYNGADLYYYENGEPVEQASVRMVPESCEVNVEECQGEQWRALAEQAAAAGSEYQELAGLGKSRKWTGSAERQAAGDDNQTYLCDLNNDGTEELSLVEMQTQRMSRPSFARFSKALRKSSGEGAEVLG